MNLIRSFYFNTPNLIFNINKSCHKLKQSSIRRICLSSSRSSNQDENSVKDEQNQKPMSISKYELFSEEDAPVILDIQEERRKITEDQEIVTYDEFAGINLERGTTGVFEIEDLVEILRQEKAEDIFVVKIPDEYQYADYMVIVSGKSSRHMQAMAEFIRKIFKRKMHKSDILPNLEGQNSENWMALDLGNIVLHLFSTRDRKFYDLESLWTLGKEFDSLYSKKETVTENIFENYGHLLATLTPAAEKK